MSVQLSIKQWKRIIFLLSLWPVLSISYLTYSDQLGANPVEALERHFGKWTLIFLCLTLAITPIRNITNNPQWTSFRRMLGLYAFFYSSIHLMSYAGVDYQFAWEDMKVDILKHRFVLVGFLAWLLMVPLAWTSTNKMIQRLKTRWKKLHRLVYLIAVLGVLHFFWLTKKDMTQPMIYAAIVGFLLIIRLDFFKRRWW
jgi:methionine sulfoxide reductase heme-binding subunit